MNCKEWHDKSYKENGFSAQRRYPNEELLRFFGRHYSSIPTVKRRGIKVLELGCGSGANLWMCAREGFDSYGIDFSAEAVDLAQRMCGHWWVNASVKQGDMTEIPHESQTFDVVFDVFSAYCLSIKDFGKCLDEVRRVLKPGGRFFSYTPSKGSQVFKDTPDKIDSNTLNGVPDGGPFSGNSYPFRFIADWEYKLELSGRNFLVPHLERVGRTYDGKWFEFVVIEGEKC